MKQSAHRTDGKVKTLYTNAICMSYHGFISLQVHTRIEIGIYWIFRGKNTAFVRIFSQKFHNFRTYTRLSECEHYTHVFWVFFSTQASVCSDAVRYLCTIYERSLCFSNFVWMNSLSVNLLFTDFRLEYFVWQLAIAAANEQHTHATRAKVCLVSSQKIVLDLPIQSNFSNNNIHKQRNELSSKFSRNENIK